MMDPKAGISGIKKKRYPVRKAHGNEREPRGGFQRNSNRKEIRVSEYNSKPGKLPL